MSGTNAKTKVLMSFGSIDGGFEFAMQLRLDIYKKFNRDAVKEPNFCYLDAESLNGVSGTSYTYDRLTDKSMMSNAAWESHYNKAMEDCTTMILLITSKWLTSRWCWQELDTLLRLAGTRNSINTIVVTWPDARRLLNEKKWSQRKGNPKDPEVKRSDSDFWERIRKIGGHNIEVLDETRVIGKVGRQSEPNTYAYLSSSEETNKILALVKVD